MDQQTIIATVKGMRDAMRVLALGGDNVRDELWEHVQSADHMLEFLESVTGEDSAAVVASEALRYASKYIKELGRFHGMIAILKERHRLLNTKYHPVGNSSYTMNELHDIGRDFWLLVNLLDTERENEHHEQKEFSGSPGPSDLERSLYKGGGGLLDHRTPEPPTDGGPKGAA